MAKEDGKAKEGTTAWDAVENTAMDFDIPEVEVEDVSTASESYYEQNRDNLATRARRRWRNNEGGYRDRGLQRAQDKRALARAQVADKKFAKRRERMLKASPRTKRARLIGSEDPSAEDDTGTWVWSSGVLAIHCGKSPPTMRTWIEERVVPGCTIILGDRYWFSLALLEAIAEGVRKTLFIDGRGPHSKLRRYIATEIERRGVPIVPLPDA
jgi:predicted GIY-YIG superfamily endonuclease